jgi:chromosome segregation ATPase
VTAAHDLPLVRARKEASAQKRQAVLDAIRDMQQSGVRITFAGVARHARVSEGLVHDPALKKSIAEAIAHQREHGIDPEASRVPARSRVTADSLRQDLELARAEVRDLRKENRALHSRLQRTLGAEVQALTQQDALARIDELERRNRDLLAEIDAAQAACRALEADKAALEEDLLASRAAHTRLMRQINTSA